MGARFSNLFQQLRIQRVQKAHIVTVEDNLRKGGFGSKVLEYYGDAGIQTDVLNLAFPDKYIEQGTQAQLFERYGLDAAGIYKSIKERLGE